MKPLTHFKRTRILPLLIAPAFVALAPSLRAGGCGDRLEPDCVDAIVAKAGQPPPVSALSFAMVHGAVYDAVNAIDRGHRPYLVQPSANPTDSKAAAAATAAFRVLAELFQGNCRRCSPNMITT